MKLISHIRNTHKKDIHVQQLQFESIHSFLSWKEEEEFFTKSQYIQQCGSRSYDGCDTWYYYCNRSGTFVSKSTNQRQTKSQGTSKVGEQCSAHIKALIAKDTGNVLVEYCAYHHNHAIQLAHLRIPTKTRLDIAARLKQGVTMQRILDDIRDNCSGSINRDHLITKKDIHNVKLQYNIEGVTRHKNDLLSVLSWVQEMATSHENPIIFFKQQGEMTKANIENDFLLCIQTSFQRDMLKKFGTSVICMDSTHGTNSYDFNLTSVVVIDDFGEGIPTAWLISNKEDTSTLTQFLQAVKERTGEVAPQWFMSDDAQQYFNAWTAVFGTTRTNKLLCSWHVDRAWRGALKEHIPDRELQLQIYHQLRLLLIETEQSKFRSLLQEFLSYIHQHHHTFYSYFNKYYIPRLEEWATCFRAQTSVNTNMFLEAFHRVLKVVYFQHKQNRRVDVLLTTLLKIARDKEFERLTKVEKGKPTHRICEINKRHKSAMDIHGKKYGNFTTIETDQKWEVMSLSKPETKYIIQRKLASCDCKLNCSSCKVCTHMFSCTCLDSILHSTVCKHVHLLVIENKENVTTKVSPPVASCSEIDLCATPTPGTTSSTQPHNHLSYVRKAMTSDVSELLLLMSRSSNIESFNAAKTHLKAAISIFKVMDQVGTPPSSQKKRYVPPNANHEKQFFSTKKRRCKVLQSITKPSDDQTEEQRLVLSQTTPKFCGACCQEDDATSGEMISWICCTSCNMWLHEHCTTTPIQETYICQFCQQ